MTTGERIRAARLRAGLTQQELAEKIGISYQGIGQWERDARKPKIETLSKIADAVGAPVPFLMGNGTLEDYERDDECKRKLKALVDDGHLSDLAKICGSPESEVLFVIDSNSPSAMALRTLLYTMASGYFYLWYPERYHEDIVPYSQTDEGKLLTAFRQLNDAGKAKALERVEELTELPKYRV